MGVHGVNCMTGGEGRDLEKFVTDCHDCPRQKKIADLWSSLGLMTISRALDPPVAIFRSLDAYEKSHYLGEGEAIFYVNTVHNI